MQPFACKKNTQQGLLLYFRTRLNISIARFLPVDAVDIHDGKHLAEGNDQEGDGSCKTVEKCQPVALRAHCKYESKAKAHKTGYA